MIFDSSWVPPVDSLENVITPRVLGLSHVGHIVPVL